jgi:hypothetical protein
MNVRSETAVKRERVLLRTYQFDDNNEGRVVIYPAHPTMM